MYIALGWRQTNPWGPFFSESYICELVLCFYSLVCVRPGRKPHCWFSDDAAHKYLPTLLTKGTHENIPRNRIIVILVVAMVTIFLTFINDNSITDLLGRNFYHNLGRQSTPFSPVCLKKALSKSRSPWKI